MGIILFCYLANHIKFIHFSNVGRYAYTNKFALFIFKGHNYILI